MAALRLTFLLLAALVVASNAAAPAPAPAKKVNLTAVLEKAGQFTTFMRLLDATQVADQVDNQVSNGNQGMTVFAPTDNAFQNLKPGAINGLSNQNQVKLILYHVLPKFYTIENFQTASNPVQTQASTDDGKLMGLTITYLGVNQVNVSTGVVVTQVNNALSDKFPLAVYQVDKVLLPEELFGSKKASSPKSAPVSSSPAKSKGGSVADSPKAAAGDVKSGAYGVRSMGFGFVAVLGFITMALLF